MTAAAIEKRMKSLGDPGRAAVNQSFFKTGPGEYSEGDVFLGLRVPTLRALAKEYSPAAAERSRRLDSQGRWLDVTRGC